MTTPKIDTVTRGKRVGVNRDGKAVGYTVRIRAGAWTAYVYTAAPPFDRTVTGFQTADDAVAYIAQNGEAR